MLNCLPTVYLSFDKEMMMNYLARMSPAKVKRVTQKLIAPAHVILVLQPPFNWTAVAESPSSGMGGGGVMTVSSDKRHQKQVRSMISKCHTYTPQTNQWNRKEETQNKDNQMTGKILLKPSNQLSQNTKSHTTSRT